MKTLLSPNFLVSKLFKLFYLSKPKKLSNFVFSNWFPYLYYRNPLNLLFSSDQFLYEFLLKYPQRKKMSAYKIQLKEQKKLNYNKKIQTIISASSLYYPYFLYTKIIA